MGLSASLITVLSSILVTTAAQAAPTVLHVPLFVEFRSGPANSPDYDYVAVAKVNPMLIQKGQSPQLEYVDLSSTTDFDFYGEQEKLNAALEAAGLDNAQAFGEYVPANWGDKDNYTCYRGNGNDVLEIVLNNTDRHYSDQFTVLGWKLGKKTVFGEDQTDYDQETDEDLSQHSKLWKSYDQKSDSVLILASVGDGGDDVNESWIPRCK